MGRQEELEAKVEAKKEKYAEKKDAKQAPGDLINPLMLRSMTVGAPAAGKEKWMPCVNGEVATEKPTKPQTDFNKCLNKRGFGYDVIRCANWQRSGEMDKYNTDLSRDCFFKCHEVFNQHVNLNEALYFCDN